MLQWEPIELDDALELISSAFPDELVRRYAVSRLEKADDDELLCYLLQLVQALKYEKSGESPLVNFLISRAIKNFELGDYFYWYLTVEAGLKSSKHTKLYKRVLTTYAAELQKRSEFTKNLETLHRQDWLLTRLSALVANLTSQNLDRPKRLEKLRQLLGPKGEFEDLANFPPMALPLNPNITVVGINPENAHIFKSAKAPLGLKFKTINGTEYGVIYKSGDDLRQDQLVVQIIALMDRLLKKENMDLKLTPYKVLATAEEDGMLEQIPSEALASVIKQYDSNIQKFLRSNNPDEKAPEVLDNFVKSCAGYCVITYILGIGDRHLDNLLITRAGHLFHIDFGFILGADPKPLPPPMKLCKEMVEGMGGRASPLYNSFRQYCCESYNILRKSSNLILNLFTLMSDSNILAISADPEKSILKVQEKFRLDLTDEEASMTIEVLLEESVSALFPVIVEFVHRWAQYWRS
jgi:phosphatidylinositol 3-kinase